MFELLALFAIVGVGLVLFGLVALVVGLLKIAFKIVLFPVWLALGLVKGLLVAVFAVVGIALLAVAGPVLLAIGVAVIVPLVLLALLIWGGCALFAAAV